MSTPSLDQLMELVNKVKGKQTTLDRVAQEPSQNLGWRPPGSNPNTLNYAMGKGNTPDQNRGLNQLYGSVLNRAPGQTAIGAATGGFEKGSALMDEIRLKEKAEKVGAAGTAVSGAQANFDNLEGVMTRKAAFDVNNLRAGKPQTISVDGKVKLLYPDGSVVDAGKTEGQMNRNEDERVRQVKDAKVAEELSKANIVAAEAGMAPMADIAELITDIRKGTSEYTTGTMGALGEAVPFINTDAKNRGALIETLKSKMALNKLMEMKAASSTGATGFGAMNQSELNLLLDHIAKLDQSTDAATQLRALNVIDRYYGKAMADYQGVIDAAGVVANAQAAENPPPATVQTGATGQGAPATVQPGGTYTWDEATGTFR